MMAESNTYPIYMPLSGPGGQEAHSSWIQGRGPGGWAGAGAPDLDLDLGGDDSSLYAAHVQLPMVESDEDGSPKEVGMALALSRRRGRGEAPGCV